MRTKKRNTQSSHRSFTPNDSTFSQTAHHLLSDNLQTYLETESCELGETK